MIGYLKGRILEHSEGRMSVGVGSDSSGIVGYSVNVPYGAEYGRFGAGGPIELFVHTHVREDQFELFGFALREEKELFLTLLSVSGIGPKGALGILSGSDLPRLVGAIIEGDKAFLQGLSGVGKKTAERIVVELSDTVQKKFAAGLFGKTDSQSASRAGGASAGASSGAATSRAWTDARDALLGLGYRDSEVATVLKGLQEKGTQTQRAEELIRSALKELS